MKARKIYLPAAQVLLLLASVCCNLPAMLPGRRPTATPSATPTPVSPIPTTAIPPIEAPPTEPPSPTSAPPTAVPPTRVQATVVPSATATLTPQPVEPTLGTGPVNPGQGNNSKVIDIELINRNCFLEYFFVDNVMKTAVFRNSSIHFATSPGPHQVKWCAHAEGAEGDCGPTKNVNWPGSTVYTIPVDPVCIVPTATKKNKK